MRASKTSVWNRSGVKALSVASRTIERRSKKGLGKSRKCTMHSMRQTVAGCVRRSTDGCLNLNPADGKLTMEVEMLIGSGRA